jgi:hypothetical protein
MARYSWNSIQNKITAHEGITPGLRSKALGLAQHFHAENVSAPTAEVGNTSVCFIWSRGENVITIIVYPKGPPALRMTYRNNNLGPVLAIVDALCGM